MIIIMDAHVCKTCDWNIIIFLVVHIYRVYISPPFSGYGTSVRLNISRSNSSGIWKVPTESESGSSISEQWISPGNRINSLLLSAISTQSKAYNHKYSFILPFSARTLLPSQLCVDTTKAGNKSRFTFAPLWFLCFGEKLRFLPFFLLCSEDFLAISLKNNSRQKLRLTQSGSGRR